MFSYLVYSLTSGIMGVVLFHFYLEYPSKVRSNPLTHSCPHMYSDDTQQASLRHVLKFATGHACIPPTGLTSKIHVTFINGTLPSTSACFGAIRLPTGSSCEEDFAKSMDTGILRPLWS